MNLYMTTLNDINAINTINDKKQRDITFNEYIINYIVGGATLVYFLYLLSYKKLASYDKTLSLIILSCISILAFTMGHAKYADVTFYTHNVLWFSYVAILLSKNVFVLLFGILFGTSMMLIWEWNGGCSLGSDDPSGENGKGLVGNLCGTVTLLCIINYVYRYSYLRIKN